MAFSAQFRFYAELNDFLPPSKKNKEIYYHFSKNPSVKDAIESMGIPHTEVELIVVNGESKNFNYQLKDGDKISVYPVFESIDISPLIKLRDKPLREPKFICDVHLGRLAKLLRLLGFDTCYSNKYSDEDIIDISLKERRCILTKDRGILKRKVVTHGYCVRSIFPKKQLIEVLKRFDLYKAINPFTLCMECGGKLNKKAKSEIINTLEEKTKQYYNEFYKCDNCGKIYWKGSHFYSLEKLVENIKK
jgi:uncharacterized protein with PIN domain/molybdopterin converting factor small subunit